MFWKGCSIRAGVTAIVCVNGRRKRSRRKIPSISPPYFIPPLSPFFTFGYLICARRRKKYVFSGLFLASLFLRLHIRGRRRKKIFSTEEEGRYFFLFFLKIYLCSRPFCSEWIFFFSFGIAPQRGSGFSSSIARKAIPVNFPEKGSILLVVCSAVRACVYTIQG